MAELIEVWGWWMVSTREELKAECTWKTRKSRGEDACLFRVQVGKSESSPHGDGRTAAHSSGPLERGPNARPGRRGRTYEEMPLPAAQKAAGTKQQYTVPTGGLSSAVGGAGLGEGEEEEAASAPRATV